MGRLHYPGEMKNKGYAKFGEGAVISRMSSSFFQYGSWCAMELIDRKEITCKWQNYSLFSNKCALLSVTSNAKYNESELCKTVRLTIFQNPQLQSVSIFFNFIHPYLLLHLHYYLYLLLLFSAVIFLFHSISWQFPLLEFW